MKNKIIVVLCMLLLPVLSLAQGKMGHEKLNLDCSTCHSCENPTKSNPCLVECPRHEMITVHHSPEEGPGMIKMDNFRGENDLYGPVPFTHRLHAEMSGMSGGCEMCHHYNPPGNVVPCSDCHPKERKREDVYKPDLKGAYHQQCFDCHKSWSSTNDCTQCHAPKGEDVKVAEDQPKKRVHPEIKEPGKVVYTTEYDDGDKVTFFHNQHSGLFGFDCADCHRNESCERCHKTEKEPVELSFEQKHAKCSACHDTEDTCEDCHQQEERKPFDHKDASGFALKTYHTGIKCAMCHGSGKSFAGLNSGCDNCHGNWNYENFDHKATGFKLTEPHDEFECDSCHREENYAKPACDVCHEDMSYPDVSPGVRIN